MRNEVDKSHKVWRWFFGAAAAYNLMIGGAGLADFSAPVNDRIINLLVVCFGVIYGMVARDPLRFSPVLWAGILGKLGIVAMLAPAVFAGTAQPGVGVVLIGDMLFTLGFLLFLFGQRRAVSDGGV